MSIHIEVKNNKLYSPMPDTYDSRPAEVITAAYENADVELLDLWYWFQDFEDKHWLGKNYHYEYFENCEAISLMKRNGNIVGFSCIKKMDIGHRLLTRLYQEPQNRVKFSREFMRPTIFTMVEQQMLMSNMLGLDNLFISREPRANKYFKKWCHFLNEKSSCQWEYKQELIETVPGSWQNTVWRKQ